MDPEAIHRLLMPATYGRLLTRMFPPERLLAGTGLSAEQLEDSELRITVAQALRYVDNALALADTPDWYLAWANELSDHFHGPISVALMTAPTLGDGLDAFLRYFPGRIPYLHMQGRHVGESFVAELAPLIDLGHARPLLIETPFIILQRYMHEVYGVDWTQAAIELDYPPTPHSARYPRYFRCPVRFNCARAAFILPTAWRALPNLGFSAASWAHALHQCAQTIGSSADRNTLAQVQSLLCAAFERRPRARPVPTLQQVAAELHVSSRTLIRRLRAMGTTYQRLVDDFLRARALELLANEQLRIKEVAAALGFDNAANFGKAFKRWHGLPPGEFRARARRTQGSVPPR